MKGYDCTPLEREKVIEFISRLSDLQKKQRTEYDKLQVGESEVPPIFSLTSHPE